MNKISEDRHTYKMGIIGNCAYMAYITNKAEVNWMCLPRFDSSFIFGSLLDDEKGGSFQIMPDAYISSNQYYIENTNILCTEFEAEDGKFRVIDFAPRFEQYDRYFKPLMLVRKIELLEGNPKIKVTCTPKGNYGITEPEIVTGSNHIRYLNLEQNTRLTSDIPLTYILENQSFALTETRYCLFSYGPPLEGPLAYTCEDFLQKTTQYWKKWIKSSYLPDIHQEMLIRSALALKLHQYEDTGGIIASGTTSLPEAPGSGRNWDYRYCWLRDTYYTLNAFNRIGHFEELERYFDYVQNIIINEKDRIQPLYSIGANSNIIEKELPLKGYQGNQPVRIGNEAYIQVQNDVYGQILVSLIPLYTDKRINPDRHNVNKNIIKFLLEKILETMEQPDAGLWEYRTKNQFHCYTYLFHWAGSKTALKIGQIVNDIEIINLANKCIELSVEKIEACYDPVRKVYTQAIGNPNLDASTLKLITMNYLDPKSDKAKNHLKALEEDLKTEEGLFYRYKHQDDFGTPDTTFFVCAFWYVEALACVERLDEAEKVIQNLNKYANHVGLFSEDVGEDGSQWGNFPQTYSHVGLINAAYRISRKRDLPTYSWDID